MKSSAAQNKAPVNSRKKENKWIKPVCITAVILAIAIAAAVILPNVLGSKEESTRITTYTISKVRHRGQYPNPVLTGIFPPALC